MFRGHSRLQVRLALVVWLAITALAVGDVVNLMAARDQTIRAAQLETTNLSRSLADQVHGVFETLDTLLIGLRERVETDGLSAPAVERLHRLLNLRASSLPMLHRMMVVDAQGHIIVRSDSGQPPPYDVAAQDFFQAARASPDRGAFIGRPVHEQGDGAALTISRRLNGPGGEFAGVVVASVTSELFQQAFAGFDTGRKGVILLARDDGVLMARMPMLPGGAGRDLSHSTLFSTILRPGNRLTFRMLSKDDGTVRLGSYCRVPGLPMLVMVGRSEPEILAGWRRSAIAHLAGLIVTVAVIGLLAHNLSRKIESDEQGRRQLSESNRRLAESEAQMARAKRWLEMAEQIAQVGHWYLDLQGDFRLALSEEWYRIHRVDPDHFEPTIDNAIACYRPEDCARIRGEVTEAVMSGQPFEVELRLAGTEEDARDLLARVVPQVDADGTVRAIFGVVMNITGQKRNEAALVAAHAAAERAKQSLEQANRSLEALAMQDSLTGLSNRRHFDRSLDSEFRRAVRTGTSLALIMIDVDQFKPFNDMYGHPAGDACLRAIAAAIPPLLQRPGDMAARYGGEEIAILLPGNTEDGARDVAERVGEAVRDLGWVHAGSQHGVVTISAGIAAFVPVHEQDLPGELVQRADLALYAAKRAGRDRVLGYTDLTSDQTRPGRDRVGT
jgi:diguanylate cyclase (GGDEF)-like protein